MRFGRSPKQPSRPQQPQMPQQPEMPQKAVPPGLEKLMEMRRDSPISIGRPQMPPGMPQATPIPRVPMGGGSFNADQMQKIQKMKEMQQGKPLGTMGAGLAGMSKQDLQTLMQRGSTPNLTPTKMKKGGVVKSSASKRADGCASKGKTKGRFV